MKVQFPNFSVDNGRVASAGIVTPASPELQAMAAIYVVLQEINEKLDKSDHAPASHAPKEKK